MDKSVLVEALQALPDEVLLGVFRDVFRVRRPNPEEDDFNRNTFFLGTASSVLDNDQPDTWGPYEIEAVAYPDERYGNHPGPDGGFYQFGECMNCHTNVRSNVKHGICSVCGHDVYMT